MKRKLQLVAVIIASSMLSSCGVDTISKIDLIPVKSEKEYQYIDREGKIIINPQFKDATVFRDGLALVETSGDEPKFGFITKEGKYAINAQYKDATIFNDGLSWVVTENGAPTAINKEGELKFTMQDAEKVRLFKEGLAAFSMINEEGEENWGFVDKSGKVIINPQFKAVSNFSEDLCGVKNDDGKWGFIDKEGKFIINFQFNGTDDFKNGKCIVTSDNKKGVIDEEGKYIINPQFNDMKIDDDDMFLINQDGKWGWCDIDGKLIINPQFEKAFPFNGNDISAVKSGEKYGYIDKEGKIIINSQFDNAFPFNYDLAIVVNSQKAGFINKEGKYVINPQYNEISSDFIRYLLTGGTTYNSVNTDYFNVDAITNIVNFDSPEGLTSNSTFDDIMKKYKLEENDFSKWKKEFEVVSLKKITNDASYNFYIIGSPYDKKTVNVNLGYYSYNTTKNVFNGKNKPEAYKYLISLTGKGYGKQDAVISAIESKLSGYKKDENESDKDKVVYSNEKTKITLTKEIIDVAVVIEYKIFNDKNTNVEDEVSSILSDEYDGVEDEIFDYYEIEDPDGYSNLRKTPGGDIIKKVYEGEMFTVLGEKGKYKKVELEDGTIGYIHSSRVVKSLE